MKKLMFVAAALAAAVGLTGCASCKTCCCATKNAPLPKYENKDFYVGGTFDADGINQGGKFDAAKATQAYFDMFKRFGYPVYPALKDASLTKPGLGFWAVDFMKGDFMHYGMGGVIWVDEIKEEYFGHDIYLLPGQSIAEHSHVAGHVKEKDRWTGQVFDKDIPPKMESWLVRHGWVYGFSDAGEPNLDKFPEAKAQLSKLLTKVDPKTGKALLKSVHVEKWTADGVAHKLPRTCGWHFMMGGTEGAIVSEFANFHDGNCNRYTVPGVGF